MTSIGSTLSPAAMAASSTTQAAPGAIDDAKAKRDTERLRQATQAVETLKRRTDDARAERKAIAKRKLDALKEQLRQLQMYGGSPRQIAQLAKELAAAVKSYASAGGSDGGAPGAGGQAGESQAGAAPEAAATEGGEAKGGEAKGADAAQAKAAADVATPEEANPEEEDGAADEAPASKDEARSPYDKALKAQEEDARRQARMGAEADEDRQFLALARNLAKALKAAADREAARAKGSEAADAKSADKAARDAIRAVDDAERDLSDTASPLSMVFMSI